MRESRPPGSVRGVPSNGHPYRDAARSLVEQLRAEVHTIDETASSLTTPTADPSLDETPQALNGGFR